MDTVKADKTIDHTKLDKKLNEWLKLKRRAAGDDERQKVTPWWDKEALMNKHGLTPGVDTFEEAEKREKEQQEKEQAK